MNSLLSIGSGSTMDGAYGINDVGQILAIATHDGQRFAVDLAPTPATPESSVWLWCY